MEIEILATPCLHELDYRWKRPSDGVEICANCGREWKPVRPQAAKKAKWPTDELRERALVAIRRGAFAWEAARAAGVGYDVWRRWWRRRKDFVNKHGRRIPARPDCQAFFEAVEIATAEKRIEMAEVVLSAPGGAKNYLERGPGRPQGPPKPSGWGAGWGEAPEARRIEVSGPGGRPIQGMVAHAHAMAPPRVDLSRLTDDELAQYEALQAKICGETPMLSTSAIGIESAVEAETLDAEIVPEDGALEEE